jgi:hypothetical protein
VAIRLLEVVADDLVVPGQLRVRVSRKPCREARVQLGTEQPRHRCVRDVADQYVVEAKAVVAGEERAVRADELLAGEGEQRATEARAVLQQRLDGSAVEEPALDRCALHHSALLGLEAVDARREKRLDRGWNGVRAGAWIVGKHGEHLLDEQRVALGGLHDPAANLLGDILFAQESVDELLLIAAVWVNWEADDERAVYEWNAEATRIALAAGAAGRPSADEVRGAGEPWNAYFRPA